MKSIQLYFSGPQRPGLHHWYNLRKNTEHINYAYHQVFDHTYYAVEDYSEQDDPNVMLNVHFCRQLNAGKDYPYCVI